ncbi:MAG: 4'-phosphopantetheinyl transferase superfamily protein [Alphaproteobacteria bacterium]|nr:4'-phosphopantetheinyl transferase superfamily protein [Alphaproteobacteria bacterium]
MRTDGIALLSPSERQRYGDMKHPTPADRFLLGRVLLRRVLAQYLDTDPAALLFRFNDNGKPELANPTSSGVSFSLSHSGKDIVLAVARAAAIGVDLEALDRAAAAYRISQRFFSLPERQHIETLGEERTTRALFLWALKESIVKARGDTVWDGLEGISLVIDGNRIDWLPPTDMGEAAWKLAAGVFCENFVLALAVNLPNSQASRELGVRAYRFGQDTIEELSFEPISRN